MLKQVIIPIQKLFIIALLGSLVACGGEELEVLNSSPNGHLASLSSSSEVTLELSGSVGDGPVISGNITIKDATDAIVVTSLSDDNARYAVSIPEGVAYPLTITVSGGIDTITSAAPTYEMISVVENAHQTTANINSFTTLVTKSAEVMTGGLNLRNISLAKLQITNSVSFGLNNDVMPDVVTSKITENNVSSYVKASVALSEWLRRTHSTLQAEEESWTQDHLVTVLSADLADGVLDGQGVGADEIAAATANVLSAQILIEMLSHTLMIASVDVTTSL